MKILIFSAHPYEIPFFEKASLHKHEVSFTNKKLSLKTTDLAKGHDAIVIFTADDASGDVLNRLQQLGIQYVALRSAGYDHVDLAAAKRCKIQLANVPAYSPYAIAEHAVTLLLALNRHIIESQRLIKLQDFRLDTLVGFDLNGKTAGIIGTGTIGMVFAKIMHGFGVNLIAYDVSPNEKAIALGIRYVPMDELYAKSDIISIHCPLNEHTQYLIAKAQLKIMKQGCILINTSRGGIVNTRDLIEMLENGHLGGACIDVYENEKALFFEDHSTSKINDDLFYRLLSIKNVIVTGHQAFLTKEALQGIVSTTIENIDCWQNGRPSPHEL